MKKVWTHFGNHSLNTLYMVKSGVWNAWIFVCEDTKYANLVQLPFCTLKPCDIKKKNRLHYLQAHPTNVANLLSIPLLRGQLETVEMPLVMTFMPIFQRLFLEGTQNCDFRLTFTADPIIFKNGTTKRHLDRKIHLHLNYQWLISWGGGQQGWKVWVLWALLKCLTVHPTHSQRHSWGKEHQKWWRKDLWKSSPKK